MGTPMPEYAWARPRAPPGSVSRRDILPPLISNLTIERDPTVTSAQFIACRDHAAFPMSFTVLWDDPNSGSGESKSSGEFASGTKAIDMSEYHLTEGASLVPRVNALAGANHDGNAPVAYAANGETATYNVTGITFFFKVDLLPPD